MKKKKMGGALPPPHPLLRGGAVPRFILGRAPLRSTWFHSKAESHTSLRLRRQQMHRFKIAERPSAPVQASGAPEGYRGQEPLRKRDEEKRWRRPQKFCV